MRNQLPAFSEPKHFDRISEYYNILCPEFPSFLEKYLSLPLLSRLKGIGLLCGTDWTALYRNRFFYSRFDHSVGTALIAWNFTHDKKQALASLFHDVSTSVFSHVSDFRKGDAMRQEVTENLNSKMILDDKRLCALLEKDGLRAADVCDYHVYPVCDNEIPRLSSDRLEYMFPSGMALCCAGDDSAPFWTLDEIAEIYGDISVLKNEEGQDELGFNSVEYAEAYCAGFCGTGLMLQKNENKLALDLLGSVMNMAIELNIISEKDCFLLSEREVMEKFAAAANDANDDSVSDSDLSGRRFSVLFNTFINMTAIEHTDTELPDSYCVSLNVKKRYINPLVRTESGIHRVTDVSSLAAKTVRDFLSFRDTKYGCVRLAGKNQPVQ